MMPTQTLPNGDEMREMNFPSAGIDLSKAYARQSPRDIGNGEYARTTPVGINVRTFEPGSLRRRGGQRPGLAKYLPVPVIADWLLQELAVVVVTSKSAEA